MIIALLLEHKVHMRRPVRMPVELLQQPPHGAVVRDRVRNRLDGLEPEESFLVTVHDAAAVGTFTVRVLHVVVARRVRLPDVNLHALDGLAVGVLERAQDEERLSLGIVGHHVACGHLLRFMGVEGAQDGALRGALGLGVVDGVDEEGEAEDVGEEDEFLYTLVSSLAIQSTGEDAAYLSHITAYLTDLRQELQAGHPLFGAEPGLARKVVQVGDQPLQHVLQAGILAEGVDEDDILGDVVDGEILQGRDLDLGGIHLEVFLVSFLGGGRVRGEEKELKTRLLQRICTRAETVSNSNRSHKLLDTTTTRYTNASPSPTERMASLVGR